MLNKEPEDPGAPLELYKRKTPKREIGVGREASGVVSAPQIPLGLK